ncbi:MAG: ferritin [Stellaceae bacterium]
MSSEGLHAPRERLSRQSLLLHQAIASLTEELAAVDWYRQRADDTEDDALKELLLHNMREEMEHASMLLEWIRRHDRDFAGHLKTYLFTEK